MRAAWLVPLVLVACAYGSGRKGFFYQIDLREVERVVFVLDVSGSMREMTGQPIEKEVLGTAEEQLGGLLGPLGPTIEQQMEQRRKKIEEARRRLISAVDGMDQATWVNLVYFSGEAQTWRPEPVQADQPTREELKGFLDALSADGGTNILAGVTAGFDQHPTVLVVVSDGVPSTSTPAEILATVRERNADHAVIVHSVGIGEDTDREFMEALAAENGGKYVAR
jgi:Mg-chelatase subunit ChlD